NPATYTGVFDAIRTLFAGLPESENRFTARTFSFNVAGGRCEVCEGSGQRKIEMHFLPDVWVQCEECQGARYREEVLEVKYHGRSIADVLNMSCGEASELFCDHPKILRVVQTLCDVGLDYVTLGQSAPTLSGGEAQRVKLAAELSRPMTGRTLYVLDEPTTGLHFDDIAKLLHVIQRLVEMGNTVLVVEHNLDVIKCADWVIDMGPDAGVGGGHVVFAGTPERLVEHSEKTKPKRKSSRTATPIKPVAAGTKRLHSQTGLYLKEVLTRAERMSDSPTAPAEIHQYAEPSHSLVSSASRDQDSRSPSPRHVESATGSASMVAEPNVETNSEPVLQPWQALGKKWHQLAKGFPRDQKPQWPLEMVELTLKMMERLAGSAALAYESASAVDVRVDDGHAWAKVQTKRSESLNITLQGPAEAIDLDQLEALEVNGPVETTDPDACRVTLQLTDPKHVRSRKLRQFLKTHLERTLESERG
ncbi:MAG: excinuclease ABC subunit A, partial [Planctomycetota bacterium]